MSDTASHAFDDAMSVRAPGRGVWRVVDASLLRLLDASVTTAFKGHLLVTLPSGRAAMLGRGGGVEASVELSSYLPVWRAARRGLLGIAESFMAGELDTADLGHLFRFFLQNEKELAAALPHLTRSSPRDRSFHAGHANTLTGSRRNIAAHYDLGNEFYKLWLDPEMSYSSAIWRRPDATLEEAQAEKHRRILEALDIGIDDRVLEIGCGWGALAEQIAARAGYVKAITISQEQMVAAKARLAASPHRDCAEVVFEDYRNTTGTFDRVASIEMIEAVGEDHWPVYFGSLANRLRLGGHAVVQAITIREDLYEGYRRNPDFIQRYIFPGGMLPTVGIIEREAQRVGLEATTIERFGASYALTCAEWRRRFMEAWPRIQAMGFDERFRRMWLYYLTYCEVGFECGTIDVGLYRLAKA